MFFSWGVPKRQARWVALAAAALLGAALVAAPVAQAADKPEQGVGYRIAQKFGRGIVNSLTGWIEIPKQFWITTTEREILTGLTYGVAKGTGMTVMRTAAGVWETGTFFLPLPPAYETVIHPETVFEAEGRSVARR